MRITQGFLAGARFRMTVATVAMVGALAVAGCGSAGTSAPAQTAAAAPGAGTPGAASSAAPSSTPDSGAAAGSAGSGAGTCGEGTAALVKQQLTQPEIVSITTEGGCHDATIVTTLAATDVAKALAICDAAAAIAYPAGDISSVTVTGANDKELSISVKGQECIGEP